MIQLSVYENWAKIYEKMAKIWPYESEGQGHKTIAFMALPIYTHIPNLKGLTKIVTILNPKYPQISFRDTITGKVT